MIVLRDKATSYFVLLFLWRKSESALQVEQWINSLRSDPMMQNMPHKAVQFIETDNAGEWAENTKAWSEMQERTKIQTIWGCPDRKEEVARGERACGVVEVLMKAGIMQENLPPNWWVRVAKGAIWFKNRIGAINTEAKIGRDGDQVRPLEAFTDFQYSRKQIDRELSYHVPVGRLGLVHITSAKGSAIAPKTKWGVCIRMYREQPIWWSPFNGAEWKSKSFTGEKEGTQGSHVQARQKQRIP